MLKSIISNALYYSGISGLTLRILLAFKPTSLIFMYHRINSKGDNMFPGVEVSVFEKQLHVINKYFNVIKLSELINMKGKKRKPLAVITFDDGYKNVFTNAFPILKESKSPATVFIATGPVDKGDVIWTDKLNLLKDEKKAEIKEYLKKLPESEKNSELEMLLSRQGIDPNLIRPEHKMLSWEEISVMSGEGVEFGAHTVNHPILTKVSADEARKEVVESKSRIESVIGQPATTFCYPNGKSGDFNEVTKRILEENGFKCAVITIEGKADTEKEPFALRRLSLADRGPGLVVFRIIKEVLKNA